MVALAIPPPSYPIPCPSLSLALAPFPPKSPQLPPSPFRTCLSQSHQCLSTRWPPWGGPAASSSTTASPRLSGMASSSLPPSTLRSPSPTMSASRMMTTLPSLHDTPLSVTSLWRCSSFWVRPPALLTLEGGLWGPISVQPPSNMGLQDPDLSLSGSFIGLCALSLIAFSLVTSPP